MNSSSIMLAFALAGFIVIGLHNIVIGPINMAAKQTLQQPVKKYQQHQVIKALKTRMLVSKS